MSEFLGRDYPEPKLSFEANGVTLECNQENTTLSVYRKLGDTAIKRFNHLFYYDEQSDIQLYGWLGDRSQEDTDLLVASMLANGYTVVQTDEVAECDRNAYEKQVIQPLLEDLADYHFPESFF